MFEPDYLGQKTFDEIYNHISQFRSSCMDSELNPEYSKLPGTILRIATALHVIEEVYNFFYFF